VASSAFLPWPMRSLKRMRTEVLSIH